MELTALWNNWKLVRKSVHCVCLRRHYLIGTVACARTDLPQEAMHGSLRRHSAKQGYTDATSLHDNRSTMNSRAAGSSHVYTT